MTNNTFPVNGVAMPKIDRSTVMQRAWAIFREAYKYPQIKFKDIGRKCFAWALGPFWGRRPFFMPPAARPRAARSAFSVDRCE